MTPTRINRYLSMCGLASRREAERWVTAGRVAINGVPVTDLATQVQPGDKVTADGKLVVLPDHARIVLWHKPTGVLCTAMDPEGRPTIYDRLPPEFAQLRYVGRLDGSSRGLLLLTDDGELARRLTLPKYGIERVYGVTLDRDLRSQEAAAMRKGMHLPAASNEEGPIDTRPCEVKVYDQSAEIRLREGKNREIRRMLAVHGIAVLDLIRLSYGPCRLGEMPEGCWRNADENERELLYGLVDLQKDGDRGDAAADLDGPRPDGGSRS
jgi:23S rRNA pseudouridine2605 synthase